ncbi:cell wall metabolism sensor histidine kinase WalK [Paenibacillus sp. NFR01]|uniref:sensor histidine kinase n=1 Tax=Paenibacillus sp. NFR01 TaxID=1566279 RepID=UPI0008AEDD64|nr:HAMP domain-containing sensor histidine kinase [Paenibacillus sp. NFR01]SEU13018.1 Signal transduction histidine kinase [Paenibacillus sp. NFR01]
MIKKIWQYIKAVFGILVFITGFFISWNGAFFGYGWLSRHFHWNFSSYYEHLMIMGLQFFLLVLMAGSIGMATKGKQRSFYRPIINAIRQIAKGDFSVELDGGRYGQFEEIVVGINEMASELNRMETMRQDFISNVSHEIQSPLTSIRGFARALQDEGLDEASRRHYLEIIEAESGRLSGLSDNLLKLSALESESFPFEKKPYRLDKQLRDMILACEPQWLGKDIEVEAELPDVTYTGVQDLLSQVWTNLLHNSIKFTPDGGKICILLKPAEAKVEVSVKDSGIGISEEDLPRIFERFYKADKARTASGGGSGLGLSLVKKIVELHGGTVQAVSQPGEGTNITVTLPL